MLKPEIKSWYKNIGVDVVINSCSRPGHKVNGWMNGWTKLIFGMLMQIQVKNYFNNFSVAMWSKRGLGL